MEHEIILHVVSIQINWKKNLSTPTKFDWRKYLYSFAESLFWLFVLCWSQLSNLSNPLLRSSDHFWLSCVDKVTTGIYNFASLKVKVIFLRLPSVLSAPAAVKTQYFFRLCFNYTLQLIKGISSDLQKLLKCFNGTAIAAFFRIPLVLFGASRPSVFPNNLALYLRDLKSSVFAVSVLKLVASSLE